MTDEGLVVPPEETEIDSTVSPEPLPDDAEQLKALTEAGQLGVVEGELEKAPQDPPNEPDAPEEEPAEEAELVDEEYRRVHSAWVAAGKPRKFDARGVRWMMIEEAGRPKFVPTGGKSGMENYGSLSIGGR